MPPQTIDPGALAGRGLNPVTTTDPSPPTPTTPGLEPTPTRQLSSTLPLSARRASLDEGATRPPARDSVAPRRQSLPTMASSTVSPTGNTLQQLAAPLLPTSATSSPTSATPSPTIQLSQQVDLQLRLSRERLSSETNAPNSTATSAASSSRHDIESMTLAHTPREASTAAFFAMQNVRHFGPVTLVRTAVQGVVAPELARAVASHPQVAAGVQAGVLAWSLARRILSQMHSESAPDVANRAFAGQPATSSLPRQAWQAVQSVGIVGGDIGALTLTALSMARPELQPVAQAAAAIQLRAHLVSQLREFFRPTVNTVHVGNRDPQVPQPPEGRNLRSEDITPMMRLTFGAAAGAIEFGAQMLQQTVLGGQSAWNANRGLAAAAGVIAGVANMLTSSVEDHLVDSAAARRMQQTDPSHVRHIHLESRNPLAPVELGRQAERVDARVFNMMIPAFLAMGVMRAITPRMQADGTPQGGQYAVQATVNALAAGVLLGSLLALTVKSYQLNDGVRAERARPSAS